MSESAKRPAHQAGTLSTADVVLFSDGGARLDSPVPDGAALRVLLEQLIEEWRATAGWEAADNSNPQYASGLDQCAKDLEALLVTGDRREP